MGATQRFDNGTFIWLRAICVNGEKFTVFTTDGRVHRVRILCMENFHRQHSRRFEHDQCCIRYVSYHGCRTGEEVNRKR